MKSITKNYLENTNAFILSMVVAVVSVFVFANASVAHGQDYFDNWIGGDSFDVLDTPVSQYEDNWIGGDFYDVLDTPTYQYEDNWIAGDYFDTPVYEYEDNWIAGDYYDVPAYEYEDNWIAGDYYEVEEYDVYEEPIEYDVIEYDEYEYEEVYEYSSTPQYAYVPASYDYINPGYSYGAYSYAPQTYGYTHQTYAYTTPTYTHTTYTTPTYTPTPTHRSVVCTLTATDTSIDDNDSTTLRWTTENATSVSINNGIGSVAHDGSRSVSPNDTETYTLTATGPGGSDYCSVTIDVDEDEDRDNDNDNVRCDSFTVNDSSVDEGDRVTLTWRTTGARDVRINNGVGDVDDDGSERVTVDEDTTFTLTARDGNDTDTCRVTVHVDEDDPDRDSNEIPRCTLRISDTRINSGEEVTLSWTNLRTDRLILEDNHGGVIVDSRNDRNIDEDSDSINLRPTRSTEYTLTVYNGNTRRTCSVETTVDGVAITSVRSQDTISLSTVPYTGFEAGPVLTMIFYGMIVLWGLVLGYVLVFKKENAHEEVHAHGAHFVASTSVVAPEIAHDVHTVYEVPTNLPTEEIHEATVVTEENSIRDLEAHAHANATLISSDALRFIEGQGGSKEEQIATLDHVIALAKARFPKENEWTIINKDRVISLLS